MTRQEKHRQTGKVRYVKLPEDQWLRRESPHLRILSDDLADAVRKKLNLAAQSFGRKATDRYKRAFRPEVYPKTLIRPICGGCGHPMILRQVSEFLLPERRQRYQGLHEPWLQVGQAHRRCGP